jgi:hypothetical protein
MLTADELVVIERGARDFADALTFENAIGGGLRRASAAESTWCRSNIICHT